MLMAEKTLEAVFKDAISRLIPDFSDWGKLFVTRTNDAKFGDFQTNFAMTSAKTFGKNPRALAQEIVDAMKNHPAVAKLEIAGPGFINVFVSDAFLSDGVRVSGVEAYEFPFLDRNGTVVLDYSSPNIAKRMHIGHLRSTVIGDSIKRILRFLGYTVVGDNHLGDWGTQFGKLIVGYRHWLNRAAYEENAIEELERIYVEFEKLSENDPALEPMAREELKKLQDGDPENTALWKEFIDVSMREYEKVYGRLDVSFDTWYGESFFHSRMPGVLEELKSKKLAQKSEGALVVFFDEKTKLPPCLVQKQDGAFLYATSDLACLQFRKETYDLNQVIYVTDDRQQTHFRQFFTVSEMLGWNIRKAHVPFGVMRFPDGIFSTRKGNVIRLTDLLDEAAKRARAIVDEKNPELPDAEKDAVAEMVGTGAVKYADLSQNRTSTFIFEWDRVLSFEGNTAPYLQYTYARIRSILRKAETQGVQLDPAAKLLVTDPAERALATQMLQFPTAALKAAENFTPNIVADYLFTLAQAYNTFYNTLPVLKAEREVLQSRLLLCDRVSRVLKNGLGLLGIGAPERM